MREIGEVSLNFKHFSLPTKAVTNLNYKTRYIVLTWTCLRWCRGRRWRGWVSPCHGSPGASPGPPSEAGVSWHPTLTPRSGHRARCPGLLTWCQHLVLDLCCVLHLCQSPSWVSCICNSGWCSAPGRPRACALSPCGHWTPAACRTGGSGTASRHSWTGSKHYRLKGE